MLGRVVSSGWRAILQRRGPDCSRQPVSTGLPCGSLTTTAVLVNVTIQSASHIGPTPIKVCLHPGRICPVTGKLAGSLGRLSLPVPMETWVWPVAVPTVTFVAAQYMLTMGASADR